MHPLWENGMAAKPTVRIDPCLFVKELNNLARHKHRYEVFRDFVTVGAGGAQQLSWPRATKGLKRNTWRSQAVTLGRSWSSA